MKSLLIKGLSMLTRASKTVIEFLLPLLQSATAQALEALLPVALGIVAELATRNDLSGSAKRDIAVERLKAAAVQTGISVGASTLNLAVEMAVAKLKEGGK